MSGAGFAAVAAGAVCLGAWPSPIGVVASRSKTWRWHHLLLGYAPFLAAFPTALAWASCGPSMLDVLAAIPTSKVLAVFFLGFLFGTGNSSFGVVVENLGVGLASTLNPAMFLVSGTLAPLLAFDIAALGGLSGAVILIALAFAVASIVVAFFASQARDQYIWRSRHEEEALLGYSVSVLSKNGEDVDNEAIEEQAAARPASRAIFVAGGVLSGLFASMLNLGWVIGESEIKEAAARYHCSPMWAADALPWAVALCGAFVPTVAIAGSVEYFSRRHDRAAGFVMLRELHNYLASVLMATLQVGAFVLYGFGSRELGDLGASAGFAVFSAGSILTANVIGAAQGEWRGAGTRAILLICLSIFLLVIAISTMAVSVVAV